MITGKYSVYSYVHWKYIEKIKAKDIMVEEITPKFMQELSVTMLPNHETILHHLDDYDQLV